MGMAFGPIFWALAVLSAAAAVAYGLCFLNRRESLLRAGVKTLFMASLTGAFYSAGAPFPLLLALGAAACGDFFLAFDKKWLLPFGILSFLIAQLAYLVIFFFSWMFAGDIAPLWPRYVGMGAILLAVAAFLVWFWRAELRRFPVSGALAVLAIFAVGAFIPWFVMLATAAPRLISAPPSDGALIWVSLALLALAIALGFIRRDMGGVRLGAMAYAGAITAMACAAMWLPWIGWPAMLGVISFLVSDFVLAAELFRLPPDAPVRRITVPVVWWTYAAAQMLIVWGIVRVATTS